MVAKARCWASGAAQSVLARTLQEVFGSQHMSTALLDRSQVNIACQPPIRSRVVDADHLASELLSALWRGVSETLITS